MRILFFILFPLFSFGQNVLEGTVVHAATKEKVPYATVGLVKQNKGTNADENGQFSLAAAPEMTNDTLVVSCVGFETLKIPLNTAWQNVILLYPKQIVLDEVTVAAKTDWAYTHLNAAFRCGRISLTTIGYITQVAKYFSIPSANAVLLEVKICRPNNFSAKQKSLFRLRIYDVDTLTKAPAESLCDEVIEVQAKDGAITVNVEKYGIRIRGKQFFVAVEWLKVPYNENRSKVKTNGEATERISYRPYIGITHAVAYDKRPVKGFSYPVWGLNYSSRWFPLLNIENIAISATIKH